MRLATNLRALRGDRPLPAVAEAIGLNKGTLSAVERGRQLPTDAQALAMAPVYGPASGWFVDEAEGGLYGLVLAMLLPDEDAAEAAA